jgi:hypothetical protein
MHQLMTEKQHKAAKPSFFVHHGGGVMCSKCACVAHNQAFQHTHMYTFIYKMLKKTFLSLRHFVQAY